MEFKSKPNTTSENKKYNTLVKKLKDNPENINDEEMDMFLSLMEKESDTNMTKYCNARK